MFCIFVLSSSQLVSSFKSRPPPSPVSSPKPSSPVSYWPHPFPNLYNLSSVFGSVLDCGWPASLFLRVFDLRLSNVLSHRVPFYTSYLKDSDLTEAVTLSNKEFLRFSPSSLSSFSSEVSSFLCTRNIRHQG